MLQAVGYSSRWSVPSPTRRGRGDPRAEGPKEVRTTTSDDLETLRSDIQRLGRSVEHRTDTAAEGRQVAEFVHALLAQFDC